MIQIHPGQVTTVLKSFFDPRIPTAIRCFSVLAGGNAGKILTDNQDHPRWCFVWERDDGTLYRGGTYDKQVLNRIVELLRQDGDVALGYRDGDPATNLFPTYPHASAACLEFDRPIGSRDLSPYLGQLPVGYEIHLMERKLLEQSPHYEATLRRYDSIENFLDKGLIVCLMHGETTVCEAYADMDVMGVRELGVTTQEIYRGQGFATITCAHLIKLCEELACQTYWDCTKHNLASVAVARKLGFRNEREYKLMAWFKVKG